MVEVPDNQNSDRDTQMSKLREEEMMALAEIPL